MSLFFALLALLLLAAILVIVVGYVVARPAIRPLLNAVRPVGYEVATAVALGAMFGSLYYSEVAGFVPCILCWVQRFFMYPAAIILASGLLLRDRTRPAQAGLFLSVLGLPVALFHRFEQATGESSTFCELDNPCSSKWVDEFGFITIPTMAAIGFASVIVFLLLSGWIGSLGGVRKVSGS